MWHQMRRPMLNYLVIDRLVISTQSCWALRKQHQDRTAPLLRRFWWWKFCFPCEVVGFDLRCVNYLVWRQWRRLLIVFEVTRAVPELVWTFVLFDFALFGWTDCHGRLIFVDWIYTEECWFSMRRLRLKCSDDCCSHIPGVTTRHRNTRYDLIRSSFTFNHHCLSVVHRCCGGLLFTDLSLNIFEVWLRWSVVSCSFGGIVALPWAAFTDGNRLLRPVNRAATLLGANWVVVLCLMIPFVDVSSRVHLALWWD